MKSIIKVVAALCLAAICAGFCYAHFNTSKFTVVEKPFVEVVHGGDTVDGILWEYYNQDNEGVSFGEFKYNTLHLPENKHLLNQHGGLKLICPGEKIHIIAKVKVAK